MSFPDKIYLVDIGEDELQLGWSKIEEENCVEYQRSPWISVKDRLPENDSEVLTCSILGAYYICQYHSQAGFDVTVFNGTKITHWMPLPTPPKGE